MTVAQLDREMDYAELVEWRALDEIRLAESDSERTRAQKGMRPRRGFRGR